MNDMRNLCISCGGRNASKFIDDARDRDSEDPVEDGKNTYGWTKNMPVYRMEGETTAMPNEVVLVDKSYRSIVVRTTDYQMEDVLVLGALTSGKYCSIQINRAGQFRLRCTLLNAGTWQTHNVNGVVSIDTTEELIDSFVRYD